MIECDLLDCVLNKRGECMKTCKDMCPYFREVLTKRIERQKKLEFAKAWAKDYNDKITREKENKNVAVEEKE